MTSLHRVLHKKLKNEMIKWRQYEDWNVYNDTGRHTPDYIFNGRTDWYINIGERQKYFLIPVNHGEIPNTGEKDVEWSLYARTNKGVITYERLADTL